VEAILAKRTIAADGSEAEINQRRAAGVVRAGSTPGSDDGVMAALRSYGPGD